MVIVKALKLIGVQFPANGLTMAVQGFEDCSAPGRGLGARNQCQSDRPVAGCVGRRGD